MPVSNVSTCASALRALQVSGGRPGLPVSVLVGHGGAAAFVDFHPTHPDALLSASFDGTCRIWRARDASAPPIVLTVDPARFGLSGHAVTRWVQHRQLPSVGQACPHGCALIRCCSMRCACPASMLGCPPPLQQRSRGAPSLPTFVSLQPGRPGLARAGWPQGRCCHSRGRRPGCRAGCAYHPQHGASAAEPAGQRLSRHSGGGSPGALWQPAAAGRHPAERSCPAAAGPQ